MDEGAAAKVQLNSANRKASTHTACAPESEALMSHECHLGLCMEEEERNTELTGSGGKP